MDRSSEYNIIKSLLIKRSKSDIGPPPYRFRPIRFDSNSKLEWTDYSWEQVYQNVKNASLGIRKIGLKKKSPRIALISEQSTDALEMLFTAWSIGSELYPVDPKSSIKESVELLKNNHIELVAIENNNDIDRLNAYLRKFKIELPELKFVMSFSDTAYRDPEGVRFEILRMSQIRDAGLACPDIERNQFQEWIEALDLSETALHFATPQKPKAFSHEAMLAALNQLPNQLKGGINSKKNHDITFASFSLGTTIGILQMLAPLVTPLTLCFTNGEPSPIDLKEIQPTSYWLGRVPLEKAVKTELIYDIIGSRFRALFVFTEEPYQIDERIVRANRYSITSMIMVKNAFGPVACRRHEIDKDANSFGTLTDGFSIRQIDGELYIKSAQLCESSADSSEWTQNGYWNTRFKGGVNSDGVIHADAPGDFFILRQKLERAARDFDLIEDFVMSTQHPYSAILTVSVEGAIRFTGRHQIDLPSEHSQIVESPSILHEVELIVDSINQLLSGEKKLVRVTVLPGRLDYARHDFNPIGSPRFAAIQARCRASKSGLDSRTGSGIFLHHG